MKASIIFFPNEAKKSQRTGKIPIYMRVCFKAGKSETRLNAELEEKDLLKWDPRTMRLVERNSAVNHQLNRMDQKFTEFLILNANELPLFNAAAIKDYVIGTSKSQALSVMKFVDDYFQNSVANNVNRTPGTVKNYRKAINHFSAFLDIRKQKSLLMHQLDFEFAAAFKNYLVCSDPETNRVGMTEVSAAGIIKKFRTILRRQSIRKF